ncbi:endo alpha-1,4 polygalactosaminidase [Thermomicrobium sp.]
MRRPLACRSQQAHARGLAIGLENDAEQATGLVGDVDRILVESCLAEGWCGLTAPFRQAGKPVFAIEYVAHGTSLADICREARRFGLSAQLKRRELDAWSRPCWRVRAQTIGR